MIEMHNLVTFVVSTYKRHEALRNCLTSVRVSYPWSKVIVVNDDPNDFRLVFDDPGIFCFQNSKNMGCPKSRSIGATLVETPFIFFLDDDATIGNVDIATAVEVLLKHKSIAVCGFSARNHINDEVFLTGYSGPIENSTEPFFDTPAFNGGACLIRTDFFLPRGYHPRIRGYGEEAELTLRAISLGLRVVSLKEGGAIEHFPTVTRRDSNLARQRTNDIATAFEYGGMLWGCRQFAAHLIVAKKMLSFSQILGCFQGIMAGVRIINLRDKRKKVVYRNWLRLARIASTW